MKNSMFLTFTLLLFAGILFADYSVVLGGRDNNITAEYSLAFGNDVNVSTSYTAAFFSTANSGKVGINIPTGASPTAELEVNGTVKITQILHLQPIGASPPATGDMGDMCVTNDGKLWFCIDDLGAWKEVQLVP